METYNIDRDRVSYLPAFDVLYLGYGDNSLDFCDEVADLDGGVTIMKTAGEFSGAEIHEFSCNYGSLPASILVNDTVPFVINVPAA